MVEALLAQGGDWPGPVEIILLDDGSREEFRVLNRPLAAWAGVRYRELAQNVGRAAIRNQLVAATQHQWLLLLDNDSLPPDAHLLARYAAARTQAPVLIGGTSYAPTQPADAALHLRWLYGREREARPAAVRQLAPHGQLTINNALIRADVLTRYPLDETLNGYGHEDTALGLALARAQVAVVHLDNPVLHAGLEPAAVFLQKSEEAVRNLAQMHHHPGDATESRLLKTAGQLHRLGLAPAARHLLKTLAPILRRGLLSPCPRLAHLDLLKLYWLLVAQSRRV
ncbi:hypothetical protein BEN47_07345 [Hymenobacter lapidarius]|uniref:Glycosyltransferase 2-like domain-containing protein n=1 Tax=Hymenobacter lapidarius TaxID=1908237 RepID=A0A1G1TEZ5_9BACT|nr:hypothetical protein BEN47_07345 [Hymenobacter lapidarius]